MLMIRESSPPGRIFPNNLARSKAEKRTFVADEIDDAKDLSALNHRSAFDRVSYGVRPCLIDLIPDCRLCLLVAGLSDRLGDGEAGLGSRLFAARCESIPCAPCFG